MFSRLLCFFASTPTCFTFMQIGLTHSMSSAVRNRGLSFPLKDTSAKNWAETLLLCCYTQHTGIRFGFVLFFCFLTCNWQTLISFHSDLVCADYGEGASSKGQARGHSEACYEFWSRSWPLALPPFSMCCPALQPHPYHACGLTSPHLPLLFCPLQLDEAED